VNRITSSGRVAGEDQRASRKGALRGVTLDAAYSHRLENEIGSIEPGKLTKLILEDNPLTVDAIAIKDIGVWGTVMEGRKLKVGHADQSDAFLDLPSGARSRVEFAQAAIGHVIKLLDAHG